MNKKLEEHLSRHDCQNCDVSSDCPARGGIEHYRKHPEAYDQFHEVLHNYYNHIKSTVAQADNMTEVASMCFEMGYLAGIGIDKHILGRSF